MVVMGVLVIRKGLVEELVDSLYTFQSNGLVAGIDFFRGGSVKLVG